MQAHNPSAEAQTHFYYGNLVAVIDHAQVSKIDSVDLRRTKLRVDAVRTGRMVKAVLETNHRTYVAGLPPFAQHQPAATTTVT